MATRSKRNDDAECLDPGFLTVCHHTNVALSDGWSVSGSAVRLRFTQQPERSRELGIRLP